MPIADGDIKLLNDGIQIVSWKMGVEETRKSYGTKVSGWKRNLFSQEFVFEKTVIKSHIVCDENTINELLKYVVFDLSKCWCVF